MPVSNTAEYIALLRKSGALKDSLVDQIETKYASLQEPKQLARKLVDRNLLTDWQSRFLLTGRHRLKVGQYKLLNRFAKQVYGDRFLAIHEQLDRKVDVLIFPKEAARNKTLFQQFLTEAAVVAELDHVNLLHLYDIDQEGGRYFLVFEHDDGDSLRNIPAGSLDSRAIADIAHKSLDAISYAHNRNVIHGKLDESQIRVDQKGRVAVRNIGLARLLEELEGEDSRVDEFAITPDASDDIVAVGRICKSLFKQHIGEPITDLDQSIYSVFGKITSITDVTDGQTKLLLEDLDQWLIREKSEQARTNNFQLDSPGQSTSSTNNKDKPRQSEPKKATAKKRSSNKTTLNTADKKNRWIGVALAATGLVALGSLIWVLSGPKDDNSSTAEATNGKTAVSKMENDQSSKDGEQNRKDQITSASNETKGFRPDPNKLDKRRNKTPKSNASDTVPNDTKESKLKNRSSGTDKKNLDVPEWSTVNSNENSSPSGNTTTEQEQETKPSEPPKTIAIEGAEGLELVEWSKAVDKVDLEVVVFGKIIDVRSSNSGKTRYLNFKKNDNSAFRLVIRERDLKIEEKELEEKFLNKNVCVLGTVSEYRGDPQILIDILDQIQVVDVLPGPDTKLAGASPSSTSTVETSGVFAGMAGGLRIPVLQRNNTNYEQIELGPIQIGDDPLGLFLTVPEEACSRPIWFDISRDESGRKWAVNFAPRKSTASENQQRVAEFQLKDDKLYFNWVKQEEIIPEVNFLQNCLLKIDTGEVSKTVLLREPIATTPIVFEEKKPIWKHKIDLQYLPIPESIRVEILPLPKAEFVDQVSDYGTVLSRSQKETVVFLDKIPTNQFFRLWYSADVSSTIKMESELQINAPGKPIKFIKRNIKNFEEQLMAYQAEVNNKNATALAYEPKRGEITKHKDLIKQLSKELELVNAQVAAFQSAKPLVSGIIGRPMQYRVYYQVGDIQFDLVSPLVEQ